MDRLSQEYEDHKKRYEKNVTLLRKMCPHSQATLEDDGIGMDSWIECPACGWIGHRWPEAALARIKKEKK